MAQKLSSVVLISIALFTLISCGGGSSSDGGSSASDPQPAPPAATKIVAIGDSIGTGFGIATPWPVLLASILGVEVDNNSVSGELTDFGLSIIADRLNAQQPTHVVILMGTNDALRGSVSGAIANLQAMVDIAVGQNGAVIVATWPPITRDATENSRAAQISSGIRGLNGAQIVDVRARLSNSDIADGVHPNQGGQDKIAAAIAEAF